MLEIFLSDETHDLQFIMSLDNLIEHCAQLFPGFGFVNFLPSDNRIKEGDEVSSVQNATLSIPCANLCPVRYRFLE